MSNIISRLRFAKTRLLNISQLRFAKTRLLLILVGTCVLAGTSACGFTPLHAPSTVDAASIQNLRVDFVNTRARGATGDKVEFLLRQSLNERVGSTTSGSPYTLSLTTVVTRAAIGVRQDDVAARFDLNLRVTYKLLDSATGKVLDRGRINAVSTYGAPGDPYGLTAAQSDAEKRAAREAADLLLLEVATYFKRQ